MRRPVPRPRCGFTLVELLVVVAVIAILLGLLLPAVQSTREAASRTQCANNLHQIALAIHLYTESHGQEKRLTPSRLPGESASWAWLILPYLEKESIYRLWDLNSQPFFAAPSDAIVTPVAVYFCPTRRDGTGLGGSNPFKPPPACQLFGGVAGAMGDYAASIGTTGVDFPLSVPNGPAVPPDGTFEANRGIRLTDVLDGLSNTFLVGEKHVPTNHFGDWPWDCSIYDGHNPTCNTRAAGPGFPLATARDDTGVTFGSYHPNVCQFAMADGSVQRVFNGIDPYVLGLLASRNDGLGVPAY